MLLLESPVKDDLAEPPELLFPEARVVQRRRWRRWSLLAAGVVLGCAVIGGGAFLALGARGATGASPVVTLPPPCAGADVRTGLAISGGAAGTRLIALSFRNVGAGACTMSGYPGFTLYGPGNRKLAVAKRGRVAYLPTLTLEPGGRVFSGVEYGENPITAKQKCPAVTALRIVAPDTRRATLIARALTKGYGPLGLYCAGPPRSGPVATGGAKLALDTSLDFV